MAIDSEIDAVRIAVREKPIIENNENENVIVYHENNDQIMIVDEKPFAFDYIFHQESSQEQIFDCLVRPLVIKFVNGFYCTAIAYGQTGTGKTYSMGFGQNVKSMDDKERGMIPRALQLAFQLLTTEKSNCENEVSVSYIEIYNEKIYDLLADNFSEPINIKTQKFTGGKKQIVQFAEEALQFLTEGNKNRHVRPTKMNSNSSRSHAIYTIHIGSIGENSHTKSSFHLVDLAGSEGVRRTGHEGIALAEGVHINQGLLSIGKVLQALSVGGKVIPYRDSVLSTVLQDSLNTNSYLSLLACVSCLREDVCETLSTIRFAQNAKTLKNNPKINSVIAELKQKAKPRTPAKNYVPGSARKHKSTTVLATPTPKKRLLNSGLSTIKKPVHSNTFCTPNKTNTNNFGMRFNETTDFIFKPPIIPMSTRMSELDIVSAPPGLPVSNRISEFDTVSARSSTFSLNLSGSTAIDTPTTPTANYSPIVRNCMAAFEAKMDQKLEKIFEHIQNITNVGQMKGNATMVDSTVDNLTVTNSIDVNSTLVNSTVKENPGTSEVLTDKTNDKTTLDEERFPWNLIRTEIQKVIRSEISILNDQTQCHVPIPESVQQLPVPQFCESTPLFKVPSLPFQRKLELQKKSLDMNDSDIYNNSEVNCDATVIEKPEMKNRKKKWSVIEINSDDEGDKENVTRRVSRRLSSRKSVLQQENTIVGVRRRMSTRNDNSMLEMTRSSSEVRRSMRIATKPIKEVEEPPVEKPKEKKSKKMAMGDKIIAEYFSKQDQPRAKGQKSKKEKVCGHKNAVLELINRGSIKELQILPTVGLKTAYSIVTHRTIHGKFKKLDDLVKLFTGGKKWQKFQEANNLV